MITVTVNNKYAYHIAFCLYMIKANYVVYTDQNYDILEDHDYICYYNKVIQTLSNETNFFLPYGLIVYIMKHKLNVLITPNIGDIILDKHDCCKCGQSLIDIEKELYKKLHTQYMFFNINVFPTNIINWAVQLYYNRAATNKEIAFYNMKVASIKMNIMTLLLILRFHTEGVNLGLDQYFIDNILESKYTNPGIPNIAVIFSGYTRNYIERSVSHINFLVNNPYIDIFMHVWTDLGHKYESKLEKINPADLIAKYKPKEFASEFVWNKLKPDFSLIGKLNPIFLDNSQDKADATQYVNANLYSIKKTYELIQLYESVNHFEYNGIIKWNFDTDVSSLNMMEFWEDICKPSLYFRKGCELCDRDKCVNHANNLNSHKNNLDTSWYYGNRELMGQALTLYLDAFTIAQTNQIKNMQNLANVEYFQELDFIYLYKPIESQFNLNTIILCYHPHFLMKYHLNLITCKTAKHISGNIIHQAVFGNNL
jgi:hypothetical protein